MTDAETGGGGEDAQMVRDVERHERATFARSNVDEPVIGKAPEIEPVDDSHGVMPGLSQRFRDPWRKVLVEQQPHARADGYRRTASSNARSFISRHASISARYSR